MKPLLVSLLLATSLSTHAQIVPFAIGAAVGSSSSRSPSSPVVLTSQTPGRDVILCGRSYMNDQGSECSVNGWDKFVSAAEFAKRMGYTKVHSKGVVVVEGTQYVVMEVSR